MQYHQILLNTIKYHVIACNTIKYHAIPLNTNEYYSIAKYHRIPCNTIEYHLIPSKSSVLSTVLHPSKMAFYNTFIGLCEVKNSLKMAKHFFFTIHPVKAPDKRVACAWPCAWNFWRMANTSGDWGQCWGCWGCWGCWRQEGTVDQV